MVRPGRRIFFMRCGELPIFQEESGRSTGRCTNDQARVGARTPCLTSGGNSGREDRAEPLLCADAMMAADDLGRVASPTYREDKMVTMAVDQPGRSSIDVVEFRRRGRGSNERAIVLVNGTELARLWRSAAQREAAPLWTSILGPSLEWWGPVASTPKASWPTGINRLCPSVNVHLR